MALARRSGLLAAGIAAAALLLPGTALATISSSFSSGTLTISSNAGDAMTVACSGGNVTVNGGALPGGAVACATPAHLNVNGGSSDNTIDLSGVTSSSFTALTTVGINGGGGSDGITGSGFGDSIDGGSGTDTSNGGPGNDTLFENNEDATDTFNGDAGADTLSFSSTPGNGSLTVHPTTIDTLNGPGVVTFSGIEAGIANAPFQENFYDMTDSPFPWTINGGASNDTFFSSQFNDTFNGGSQGIADVIAARTDSASIALTNTSMSGTAVGTDTISGAERAQIISPSVANGSAVVANSTWDASGATIPVDLEGGTGNDTLIGGSASDTLGAPTPNPSGFSEETGDDRLTGNGGNDTLRGGPGTDTMVLTGVSSSVIGSSSASGNGTDPFSGMEVAEATATSGADNINATNFGGRVVESGLGSNDTLTGTSAGNDQISGGDGQDTMNGLGGLDQLVETASAPATASLDNVQLTGFGGTETIAGFESASLTGSSGADTINASGFSGPVTLNGGDGADALTGGAFADALVGGPGGDTLTGGGGADTFAAGAGDDTVAANDAAADASIDCGADTDSASIDPNDPAPTGCETINGVTQSTGGTGGTGGTTPAGGGGDTGAGGGIVVQTPVPTDTTAPVLVIAAGKVDRKGKLPLRLTCPATETSCQGSFTLTARDRKRTKLGSSTFSALGGKTATVRVKLSRRGLALLKKSGKLKAQLVLSASDAAGNAGTQTKSLTLKR